MDTVPKFPPIPKDAAKDFGDGKIIIIGSGVAGLFAANTLKYLGVDNYIVLEAGDSFGGRLKKTDNIHEEVPLDLGAEWIHAPNGNITKDMLVFQEEEDDDDDKEKEGGEFLKYNPQFWIRSKRNRFIQMIYQETKWKRSTWYDWLDKHVYRHVQDKVEFNCVVKDIIYKDDGKVKVVLENGTEHMADKVICTIPLAVLKKDDMIKFDPPLPEKKRAAINAVDMPPGIRILFEMKEKFYPDLTLNISSICQQLFGDGEDISLVYDPLYGKDLSSKQNILAFVAVGENSAGDLSQLNDEELAQAALAIIDKLFDGQGSKNCIKYEVQNWGKEPYILGAYSYPGASYSHRSELGKTVSDRVLFAGEHTSVKYHSLVPGAAYEGRRAAVEAVSGQIL